MFIDANIIDLGEWMYMEANPARLSAELVKLRGDIEDLICRVNSAMGREPAGNVIERSKLARLKLHLTHASLVTMEDGSLEPMLG